MIRTVLDAGTITAAGTALAAVITAAARLVRALRQRDCEDCRQDDVGEEAVSHGRA